MTVEHSPSVSLAALDQLWFQVAGTLCNLTCHHCFISCSPHNRSFGFLTLQTVKQRLEEARELGVKEYYFTGGEPFLNPEMTAILVTTLQYGPATVLTNGTVWKEEWLERLKRAEQTSEYSLEFRVSIDGFSAQTNDPIRGEGTFDRALQGIQRLVEAGFLPIITATRTWPQARELEIIREFRKTLQKVGYTRPRLKILPSLKLGAEAQRTGGYGQLDRVTTEMLDGYDQSQLVCHQSRIVSDRGVHVCPILIDTPDSLLGQTLKDAAVDFPLSHGACYTCYQYGSICTNPSSASGSQTAVSSPPRSHA